MKITEEQRRHVGIVAAVCANHYKTMNEKYSKGIDSMPDDDKAMYSLDSGFLVLYRWAMENGLPDFGLLEDTKKGMN